jgi:hypothetical protein
METEQFVAPTLSARGGRRAGYLYDEELYDEELEDEEESEQTPVAAVVKTFKMWARLWLASDPHIAPTLSNWYFIAQARKPLHQHAAFEASLLRRGWSAHHWVIWSAHQVVVSANLARLSEAAILVSEPRLAALVVLSVRVDPSLAIQRHEVLSPAVGIVAPPQIAAASKAERLDHLSEHDPEKAAAMIVDELSERLVERAWRAELVACAEMIDVRDGKVRAKLSEVLLKCAHEVRAGGLASDAPTLWSAIRRAITLGQTSALARLEEFLGAHEEAKTRQVALQAIANKCQRGPAPTITELAPLRARVKEICDALLNEDVLGVPQTAALGTSATVAAAALGMLEFGVFLSRFATRPLLARQVCGRVQELISGWEPSEARDMLAAATRSA